MNTNPLTQYYENLEGPHQSALLFIREVILNHSPHFSEHYKWSAPFFYYKKRMLCYFWIDKKQNTPYLSFGEGNSIHHPQLKSYGRARFKLYYIDSTKDIDVDTIKYFLDQSIKSFQEKGKI